LVPDDPLYTVAVETLVEAVSVGEGFTYDHRFAASDAFECAIASLIDQESEIYLARVSFFLQVLSIGQT